MELNSKFRQKFNTPEPYFPNALSGCMPLISEMPGRGRLRVDLSFDHGIPHDILKQCRNKLLCTYLTHRLGSMKWQDWNNPYFYTMQHEPDTQPYKNITLIGAGIMSATLGILLKGRNPNFTIAIYGRLDGGLKNKGYGIKINSFLICGYILLPRPKNP
jgi:hypothetical protein